MRALFIDIQRPLESSLRDPLINNQLGDAAVSIANVYPKPRREFRVKSWDTLFQAQIEQIRNEVHAARSSGTFYVDGDIWAEINYPMFVANGNGVQKQFPLPIDNVFPSSCKFWDDTTLKTDWTMIKDPATVVFTAAPTGRITFTGKHKFRCIMIPAEESIFTESQLYRSTEEGVYNFSGIVFREVEAINRA